eukprot:TRINITY_DN27775_c0_g1_i1.p1 TRINITY_DN27775_c0_g1~~TRINITY_DN27775_c0_g1_i1.p1  ORF type:complete len:426 (+),score=94.87 TRINITY_DN27775_c0_g1_i1:156-1433(+)
MASDEKQRASLLRADTVARCGSRLYEEGERVLLSADCGGTSTRIRIFRAPPYESPEEKYRAIFTDDKNTLFTKWYKNAGYSSLQDILETCLDDAGCPETPLVACIAVAGPVDVQKNRCSYVNLDWPDVVGEELEEELGFKKVLIINDFVAQGYGIQMLNMDQDVHTLQKGSRVENAPMAVVGAGTGLGTCFLTPSVDGYEVFPTEGGHAEFAPRQRGNSDLWYEMIKFLQIKYSAEQRISVEWVVSGRGIANIYQFLAWKFPDKINRKVHNDFLGKFHGCLERGANDPSVVAMAANSGECSLCKQAMDIFVEAYGSQCGLLSLLYMPLGGLFISGGVTAKNLAWLTKEDSLFLEAFRDKGWVSGQMEKIPIHVAMVEDLGERGAFLKASRILQALEKRASKGGMDFKPGMRRSKTSLSDGAPEAA